MQFQRHRPRYANYLGGGDCKCCGICCGARTPEELMQSVLLHADMGNISGGAVAHQILDYAGNGMYGEGFFGDLLSGIKKGISSVAKVASPILGMIPHPMAQMGSQVAGVLGGGRSRKRMIRRRVRKMK